MRLSGRLWSRNDGLQWPQPLVAPGFWLKLLDALVDTGAVTKSLQTNNQAVQHSYYYLDGVVVGDFGNDANGPETNYAQSIASRGTSPSNYGNVANFDESYDPVSGADASGPSYYTVNDGDTLQSIAQGLWGDASMWYLIAQANGLDGTETLAAGTSLVIPDKVTNVHNNSTTFQVYDPTKAIGDTQPVAAQTSPAAHHKHHGCGVLGDILLAVVAIAVAAELGPEVIGALTPSLGATGAAIAGGAIAGAAGSIASQAVGLATGIQDKFSWKGVALSAIAGGVGGGLGAVANATDAASDTLLGQLHSVLGTVPGGAFGQGLVRGVIGNVLTQGIDVATGLQRQFSWTGVAVAGVTSGVSAAVTHSFSSNVDTRVANAIGGVAGDLAGAAATTLINGSDFGDNVIAVLPDAIASTIGDFIGQKAAAQGSIQDAGQDDDAAQWAAAAHMQALDQAAGNNPFGLQLTGSDVNAPGPTQPPTDGNGAADRASAAAATKQSVDLQTTEAFQLQSDAGLMPLPSNAQIIPLTWGDDGIGRYLAPAADGYFTGSTEYINTKLVGYFSVETSNLDGLAYADNPLSDGTINRTYYDSVTGHEIGSGIPRLGVSTTLNDGLTSVEYGSSPSSTSQSYLTQLLCARIDLGSTGAGYIGWNASKTVSMLGYNVSTSYTTGIAFDSQWNFTVFDTYSFQPTTSSAGASVQRGIVLGDSENARSVLDLQGPFKSVGGQLGDLSGSSFSGQGMDGSVISGSEVVIGVGEGASVHAGGTQTYMSSVFSVKSLLGCH